MTDRGDKGDQLKLRLRIDAVDSLFFRDARPFEAASRAASGLPSPQTLAGAIRSLLAELNGVPLGRLGQSIRDGTTFAQALETFGAASGGVARVAVRGPWFSLDERLLAPAPANLYMNKEEDVLVRLDPLGSGLPGWEPPAPGMKPLWRRGRSAVQAVEGFLEVRGLERFLEGGTPALSEVVPTGAVYGYDDRTGIGVNDASNTAAAGQIYAIRMLALQPGACLVAGLQGPARTLEPLLDRPVLMRFGGEGRHVIVRAEQGSVDFWPEIASKPGRGRLIMLTTPACFDGWCPETIRPLAAAVPGFEAVSGWDLAIGGPKPNRFMVPAGSVFFLAPGDQPPADGLVDPENALIGWGNFVEGNWDHV